MSKSQVATAPATTSADKAVVTKNVMAGPIFDRLSAAGACLVALASKGMLHNNVTSKLPAAMPVADVGAKAKELAASAGWGGFNLGYLIGDRASYSACAASAGQKKAKKDSAFVWASHDGKGGVTLYTSSGNQWVRPKEAGRLQADYDRAFAQAKVAFGVK